MPISRRTLLLLSAAALCCLSCASSQDASRRAADEDGFTPLFNGRTTEGWRVHTSVPASDVGGKWEVVGGELTGDQDPPGKGGFLITDGKYGDFILKLETKLDYPVDSGIFLRMGEDGKSHQVTLDYRPGGAIGSVYLPWTQGGVHEAPEGMQHFRKDAWNDVTVQIEGEPARIRFWLNGVLVTDFTHTAATTQGVPREGYVGLQVHPGESYEAGKKVRFRNIRIKPLP